MIGAGSKAAPSFALKIFLGCSNDTFSNIFYIVVPPVGRAQGALV
jgi:hypothetical protein